VSGSSTALLDKYATERDGLLNNIDALKANALKRGEDLTAAELETITGHQERLVAIDGQLKVLTRDDQMDEEMRNKLRMARGEKAQPDVMNYRSAGHMFWDIVHANFGGQHDHDAIEARGRYGKLMERAAQHMGTTAAVTTATAGGFGGLYVAPVVGAVVDINPKTQPFLNLIGKQQAPNALTFLRPRLVDAGFTTGVGTQALQKAELASVAFNILNDTVTLATVGGYLNVSQQLLSLHPEAWNIIITQLQRRVANQGELRAITALSGSESNVVLTAATTDAAVIIKALFDAAALVFAKTGELPTWIATGPTAWARLGSLTDAAKRPLFPFLGAANALGTSSLGDFSMGPLGLNFVVTPGITTGDIWMGNSLGLEAYSYPFPVLEAIEPSVYGRQVAVAEGLGFWRPTTDEGTPAEGNGAVRIGEAP
jgi:hypothetical protein